ncbi:hypothetical protein PV04_03748 [Phialophora macrospora]|uniref:Transcription factor domain-containing protein n=1 Tax=Phialophora macrospora TaxID=1851006 RepID=A0A0D2FYQ0_9EURO|nr:hypothetical protein PV04_03748 [Phialophora macrospora]
MAERRRSTFPFIISTPQNLDRQSLALRQAHARSHAARVSHSSLHRPSVLSGPGNLCLTSSLTQDDAQASHGTEDGRDDGRAQVSFKGRRHELDFDIVGPDASPQYRTTKAQHLTKHTGVLHGAETGHQRQRSKPKPNVAGRYMSPWKLDPLYWIPYRRHRGVYVALGHFVQVSAPAVRPLYEIFDITNTYTSLPFEFIVGSETFYHTAIARLLVTANKSRDPASTDDPLVTLHQTIAIRQLRHEIDKTAVPTDLMLLTVLFLIAVDVAIGQSSSVEMHRVNLARLVKLRGGLDALGYDGYVKATIKQFDDIYTFQHGPGPLFRPIEYLPLYPSHPFSRETQDLVGTIPEGFQRLALNQILPLDVIELLSRIAHALRRCGRKNIYIPLSDAENPFHFRQRRYDTFSEACPCLFAPEHQVHPLLKPLTLALAIWSCNAYSTTRSASLVTTGFLRSLTTRLQQTPTATGTSVSAHIPSSPSVDEQECWVWIWMVAIDAWMPPDSRELLPVGKELLQCFKARFPRAATGPNIRDGILTRYFSNNDFRVRVRSLWHEVPNSSTT